MCLKNNWLRNASWRNSEFCFFFHKVFHQTIFTLSRCGNVRNGKRDNWINRKLYTINFFKSFTFSKKKVFSPFSYQRKLSYSHAGGVLRKLFDALHNFYDYRMISMRPTLLKLFIASLHKFKMLITSNSKRNWRNDLKSRRNIVRPTGYPNDEICVGVKQPLLWKVLGKILLH